MPPSRKNGIGLDLGAGPVYGAGLVRLLEAYDCARAQGLDVWRFAVAAERLRAAGLTDTDLRWLLLRKYAEQGVETTRPGDPRRRFRRVGNLSFRPRTCFVLTAAGAEFAGTICEPRGERVWAAGVAETPVWDPQRRELRLGRRLVKRYTQPAVVQELILAAFQEEGWPPRIDDPLPPAAGQDRPKRLHNAISNLNRGQRLIHFEGGGDGQSIRWRPARRAKTERRQK
jgi:hypothetical protein